MVLRIPLLVNAVDSEEETEWEPVETIMVSEHGGMIRARQNFKIGSTLDIRVRNKDRFAQARVVWTSTKVTAQGMELGFEIVDQTGFWDIKFPPDT
jgi:PilZ domain